MIPDRSLQTAADGLQVFLDGRAAKEAEDLPRARALLTAVARGALGEMRWRAEAQLAHLDYYDGRYAEGADRARRVLEEAQGVARAEAHLYLSANEIALNNGRQALREAMRALRMLPRVGGDDVRPELRFRIARQLVHVHTARGEYSDAYREATLADRLARLQGAGSGAVAAYLRGFVRTATGDGHASEDLEEAQRGWPGNGRFARWVLHVWAIAERQAGEVDAAARLNHASGQRIPWEQPLFDRAVGKTPAAPTIGGASRDEVPFRAAAAGVVAKRAGRVREAIGVLRTSIAGFEQADLGHYRRGASLALASALVAAGDRTAALEILADESSALAAASLLRWPWWSARDAQSLSEVALAAGLAKDYWSWQLASLQAPVANDEASLRAAHLTETEAHVVRVWLSRPALSRRALARELNVSEATLRNHINRIRDKLECGPRRGLPEVRAALGRLRSSLTAEQRLSDRESELK